MTERRKRERQGTPVRDLQRRHAHLAGDRTASQVSRSNRTPLIRQVHLVAHLMLQCTRCLGDNFTGTLVENRGREGGGLGSRNKEILWRKKKSHTRKFGGEFFLLYTFQTWTVYGVKFHSFKSLRQRILSITKVRVCCYFVGVESSSSDTHAFTFSAPSPRKTPYWRKKILDIG